MTKAFVSRISRVVALAGLVMAPWVVAGCGGAQEEQAAPKVAQAPPPAAMEVPGEKELKAAKAAAGKGEWKQAAELYGQVAALYGKDPELKSNAAEAELNRGIALERATELRSALEIYQKVLAANAKDSEAAQRVVRVQLALEEPQEAQKVIEAALQHHPDDVELLNLLAGVLRQNGKRQQAAATARKVLLRDQKNAAATKTLALVYADEGKLQLAETFFNNAAKLNPKDPSIHVNLGLIASKKGEHQKAMLEFEKALALDPQNAAAHANVGAIALKFRDYKRAVDSYRQAITAGMSNCTTAAALGYGLEGMQAGPEAVTQLQKAYSMCPKDHELLYTVGMICLEQMRDNECALKHFEQYSNTKEKLVKDHPVFRFIDSIKQMKTMEQAPPEEAPAEPGQEGAPADPEESADGGPAVPPDAPAGEDTAAEAAPEGALEPPAEETAAEGQDPNAPQSARGERKANDRST